MDDMTTIGSECLRGVFEAGEILRDWGFPLSEDNEPIFTGTELEEAEHRGWVALLGEPVSREWLWKRLESILRPGDVSKSVTVEVVSAAIQLASYADDGTHDVGLSDRFSKGYESSTYDRSILFWAARTKSSLPKQGIVDLVLEALNPHKAPPWIDALYAYFLQYPDSVESETLFKLVSHSRQYRELRRQPGILARLIRSGFDVKEILTKTFTDVVEPDSDYAWLYGEPLMDAVLESKNKNLVEHILRLPDDAVRKSLIVRSLACGQGHFALDAFENHLARRAGRHEELSVLLMLIASLKPDDHAWLLPYFDSPIYDIRISAVLASYWYSGRLDARIKALLQTEDDDDVLWAIQTLRYAKIASVDERGSFSFLSWYVISEANSIRSDPLTQFARALRLEGIEYLDDLDFIRSWHIDFEEASSRFCNKRYQLARWGESYRHFSWGEFTEKTGYGIPDLVFRSGILMASYGDDESRRWLDREFTMTEDEDSPGGVLYWLAALLDCAGGPMSPLASLKSRIVKYPVECNLAGNTEIPKLPEDESVLPALLGNRGLLCKRGIAHFSREIVSCYPHLAPWWIRKVESREATMAIFSHWPDASGTSSYPDDFASSESILFERGLFPESVFINTASFLSGIPAKSVPPFLASTSRMSLMDDEGDKKNIAALCAAVPDPGYRYPLVDAFLDSGRIAPSLTLAQDLSNEKNDAALPLLANLWRMAKEPETLRTIWLRFSKERGTVWENLILHTAASIEYIRQAYNHEREQGRVLALAGIEEEGDTDTEGTKRLSIELLISALETQSLGIRSEMTGRRLLLHPVIAAMNGGIVTPPKGLVRLDQKAFDGIALFLTVEYHDDTTGKVLCRVGQEPSGEIFSLLFEKQSAVAFWAYWA